MNLVNDRRNLRRVVLLLCIYLIEFVLMISTVVAVFIAFILTCYLGIDIAYNIVFWVAGVIVIVCAMAIAFVAYTIYYLINKRYSDGKKESN